MDEEQDFVAELGRHFARENGLPPMTGRVLGLLLICDPARQTVAELGAALGASRSAIGAAVAELEGWGWLRRIRVAGHRADHVELDPALWSRTMDRHPEYAALAALARRGLRLLDTAPPERGHRLRELAAFADFLAERMPALAREWEQQRGNDKEKSEKGAAR